jgi:hypothetical protein
MNGLDIKQPGFHTLAPKRAGQVIEKLTAAGWHVYVLPGKHAVDRTSFLRAVSSSLPLDPPLVLHRSWDAMKDSLWEGLLESEPKNIAIVWERSDVLQRQSPRDFEIAVAVFTRVADTLRDERVTGGPTKRVTVLAA